MAIPVVLDTSFLLLCMQCKVFFEPEVERLLEAPHFYVVLLQCIDELTKMASLHRAFSPDSRTALSLISKRRFTVERGFQGSPDSAMLAYCVERNGILCTLDRKLAKRARSQRIRVISLRGKSHLELS